MNRGQVDINNSDKEISLKDFVNFVRHCVFLTKRYISLIMVSGILLAIAGFYYSFTFKEKYIAELRFIVKSDGSSSSAMLGGISAMLGGATMGSPLERAIEIASSDRIIASALLSKVDFNGKKGILANYLIQSEKVNNKLGGYWDLNGVSFSDVDTSIVNLNYSKRKILKVLCGKLIPKSGDGIVSKSFDKKSGVVTLASTHTNEEFAILLTVEIFNKLRDFYIEQMTTSASNNVMILQKKVDSIKLELAKVQSAYARTTDQSFGLLFQEDKVDLKKLAVREQILMAMYAEAQKNLETFKFMNDSAIPTLTVIDMPYSPLVKIKRSITLFTISGFLIGSVLTFLFFLFQDWYKNHFLV